MTKVSPARSSFNGGVWGPTVLARTDHERYGSSLVGGFNFLLLAEGVASRRSGTKFQAPHFDQANPNRFVRFEFSSDQALMLEFSPARMRVHSTSGLLLEYALTASAVVSASPFVVTVAFDAGESLAVGDQVFIEGFGHNIDTQYATVSAVSGNDITLTGVDATGVTFQAGAKLSKVFHLVTDYTSNDLAVLRYVQSADTLYLFTSTRAPKELKRFGLTNWTIADMAFKDGPYLRETLSGETLTPNKTGSLIADGTTGADAFSSGAATGQPDDEAFTLDLSEFWEADGDAQKGIIGWNFTAQTPIAGVTIYYPEAQAVDNKGLPEELAPKAFKIEGSNTSATTGFEVIDTFKGYDAWQGGRSLYFELSGSPSYQWYRLNITALVGAGNLQPKIARITFMPLQTNAASLITFTLSDIKAVNDGDGFVSTDVGRRLRVRGSDTFWRWLIIEEVDSTTQVKARLQGDPLPDADPIKEWRLGLYSNTTGWPATGTFFQDRLALAGPTALPNAVAMSVTGAYDTYGPTDPAGEQQDTSGILAILNSRKIGAPRWLVAVGSSLLVGTPNGDWSITAADQAGALTSGNARADPITTRGSAFAEPVPVDAQVLRIDRAGRVLNELIFSQEAEGFKAPSMSLFAPHLGVNKFKQIVYAESPHSINWLRDGLGGLFTFTYDRDQGVFAWLEQIVGGTDVFIEDIEVLPDAEADEDQVWLSVRRTINNQTVRYVETVTRTWRDGMTLNDAFFPDSGLEAIVTGSVVRGAWHLEGETVSVLVGGSPVPPRTVTNGEIELPFAVTDTRVVLGIGVDGEIETTAFEVEMRDGTSEGKTKRISDAVLRLWDTGAGQYGRRGLPLDPLFFRDIGAPMGDPVPLFTGLKGPLTWPEGNDYTATMIYRAPADTPLPANLLGMYPQMEVQAAR